MTPPEPGAFFALLALSTAAALVVFSHAQRHGSRRATAWGIAAFLAVTIVVPVYFIRFWLRNKR